MGDFLKNAEGLGIVIVSIQFFGGASAAGLGLGGEGNRGRLAGPPIQRGSKGGIVNLQTVF
jgi:hypothetical protein